jgi:hypothetical protein
MNEKNMSVPGGYSTSSILQVPSDAMQAPIVAQSGGGGDPPSLLHIPNSAQSQPITAQMGGAQKTVQVFGESLVIRDPTERRPGGVVQDFTNNEITALKKWGFSDEMIDTDKTLGHDFLDNLYNGDCVSDTGISLLTKCSPAQTVITQLAQKIMGELEKPLTIHGVRRSDGTRDVVAPAGPYSGATGTDDMFTSLPLSTTGPSQILFACEGPTGTYCIPTDDRKTIIFGELVNKLIQDSIPGHDTLALTDEQKKVYMPISEGVTITSDDIETKLKSLRNIKIGDLLVTYKIKKSYKFADLEVKKIYDSQLNEFMNLLGKIASFTENLSSSNKNLPDVINPLIINLTNEDKKRQIQSVLHLLLDETDEEYYRLTLYDIMRTARFYNGITDENADDFARFILQTYIPMYTLDQEKKKIEEDAIQYGMLRQQTEGLKDKLETLQKSSSTPLTPEQQREAEEFSQQIQEEFDKSKLELDDALDKLGKGLITYRQALPAILGKNIGFNSSVANNLERRLKELRSGSDTQQTQTVPPISPENLAQWKDQSFLAKLVISSPPGLTTENKTFIDLTDKAIENEIVTVITWLLEDLSKNPAKYDNKTRDQILDTIITTYKIPTNSTKEAQINDENAEAFLRGLYEYIFTKNPSPTASQNEQKVQELLKEIGPANLATSEGISGILQSIPSTASIGDTTIPLDIENNSEQNRVNLVSSTGISDIIKSLPKNAPIPANNPPLKIEENEELMPTAVNLNKEPVSAKQTPMSYCVQNAKVYKIIQNDPELKGIQVYPTSSNKAEIALDKNLCKSLPDMPNTIDKINLFLENTMRLINPDFTLLPQEFIRKPGTYAKSLGINVNKQTSGNEAITIESIKQKNKNEIAIAGGSIIEEFKDKLVDPHPNITIVNTIGDGTCLVHSFLLSVSSSYRRMSDSDRLKIGQIFRVTVLVSKTTKQEIKTRLENLDEFLTDIELTMLARTFKMNIVIFIKSGSVKSIEIHKNPSIKQFIIMYNNGTLHYSAVAEELRDEVYTFIFNNIDFIKQGENVLTLSLNTNEINKNKETENTATALLAPSKGGSHRKTRKIAYRDTPSYLLKKRLKTTKKAKRRSLSHK